MVKGNRVMISKKTRKVFSSLLLVVIIMGQMSAINVFADENTQSIVDVKAEVGTPGGVANLGRKCTNNYFRKYGTNFSREKI